MNTGGPAFPHVADIVQMQGNSAIVKSFTQNGMTLRDYFAAQALQSLMQNFLANKLDLKDPMNWMDGLAGDAYSMADAMLKAREQ